MCTACLLTISHSIPCISRGRGVYPTLSRCRPHCKQTWGGVCPTPWMQTHPGAEPHRSQTPPPQGCRPPSPSLETAPLPRCSPRWRQTVLPGRQTPSPVNRMTHASKNITLPQTSFADGNYWPVCNESSAALSTLIEFLWAYD